MKHPGVHTRPNWFHFLCRSLHLNIRFLVVHLEMHIALLQSWLCHITPLKCFAMLKKQMKSPQNFYKPAPSPSQDCKNQNGTDLLSPAVVAAQDCWGCTSGHTNPVCFLANLVQGFFCALMTSTGGIMISAESFMMRASGKNRNQHWIQGRIWSI